MAAKVHPDEFEGLTILKSEVVAVVAHILFHPLNAAV